MRTQKVNRKNWFFYNFLFLMEHLLGPKLYNRVFSLLEQKLVLAISKDLEGKEHIKEPFKIIDLQKGAYTEPFKDYFAPIVFRGAAKNWESNKKWNFDYFKEKYGDEEVTLINNAGLIRDSDQANDVISFREYIDRLKGGSKEYLKFSRIVEEKNELIQDFDYKWLRKFRSKFAANDLFYFFMGGKKTMTPIHDGFAITVFVQIEGQKKWIFYPTSHRIFLGVRPCRYNYFYSEIDIAKVDEEKYPLFKYADPHEIILNPGDVLFFPSLIWHQVENVNDSIGVAYKFADLFAGIRASKMLATCFFLSTKPSFINTLFPFLPDTYNYKKTNAKTK